MEPYDKITCKDCGETFYITHKEKMWYQERELALPKRCRECRAKRKFIIQQQEAARREKKKEERKDAKQRRRKKTSAR